MDGTWDRIESLPMSIVWHDTSVSSPDGLQYQRELLSFLNLSLLPLAVFLVVTYEGATCTLAYAVLR